MAESKLSEIFIRRVDEIAAQLDSAKWYRQDSFAN